MASLNLDSCDVAAGGVENKSLFPMVAMSDAISLVLSKAQCLGSEAVGILESVNRVAAEDVCAPEAFPPFQASIMDGYAVNAPTAKGIYEIEFASLAGSAPSSLSPCKVAYITTGAQLPVGANAVVKIEDCRGAGSDITDRVEILVPTEAGANVRQVKYYYEMR
jgi:molybdopterin molybdotransferase